MSRRVAFWFSLVAAAALFVACADSDATDACKARRAAAPCTHVLFIGNSYTFSNDLPGMFAQLARAGGHAVSTLTIAAGGETLDQHVKSPITKRMLDSVTWDFVVIQEQSQIPSVEPARSFTMYPAVRTLAHDVRAAGAHPLLFVTWAHRDGWPDNGLANYAAMQAAIDSGYTQIGAELSVPLVPVGDVWARVAREHPEITLWNADGSHPTVNGTYLAACVFYAAVFKQSPAGLSAAPGITPDVARVLQAAAR